MEKNRIRSVKHRPLRIEQCEDRRLLTTYTVNDPNDYDAGSIDYADSLYSLREAVILSNQAANADLIKFHPDVFGFGLNSQGMSKTSTIDLLHGELLITNSVTIDGLAGTVLPGDSEATPGPGWEGLTIDASPSAGPGWLRQS